jgi:hypothetical protein
MGLGLHFLLELAALIMVAIWGFRAGTGWWQQISLGILLPLLLAVVWAVFRVPKDPGNAIVAIPGPVRLALELAILGGAAASFYAAGYPRWSIAFAAAIIIDYGLMAERVRWLLAVK